jgi:SAM-dependent methyltransferase
MPVTAEEVTAAYRLLLGRVPAASEVAEWQHVGSFDELRDMFWHSDEFCSRVRQIGPAAVPAGARLAHDLPPIAVEWETTPDTQGRLLDYVTRTWTRLGQEEPHWSVLSADQFRADRLEGHAEEFYASGAQDAARVVATLARHGLTPAELPRIVEYGSGVGRVTPYLAAAFREVVAIDISPSHLAMTREAVDRSGCSNVRAELARAPSFGMKAPFDVWFSHIVLQHNPPPVIALVLRGMFSILAPGGVAIFQVPTYVPGYSFNLTKYLAAPKDGSIEVHCLPQEVVFQLAAQAGCSVLEVREDTAMQYPWLSNTFVFRKWR